MLHLKKFVTLKQITEKIALLAVLLALADILYIIIFKGLWQIFYALTSVASYVPRSRILSRAADDLSFSMFLPFSIALLLTSLPVLRSYADTLKLRYIGLTAVVFMYIGLFFSIIIYGKNEGDILIAFIIGGAFSIFLLPLLIKENWHANTLIALGSLFTIASLTSFKLPDAIKSGLFSIYLIFGLINITVGYINLKGITPKLEKILKAELVLLVSLGLYRFYITGGELL